MHTNLQFQRHERQAMITVMQTRFELDQRGYHPDTDPAFSPTRMGNMHEQHRRDMPPPRMTSSRDMPLRTSSYVRAERPKRPLGPPPGFEPFRPPPGYEDFKREEFRKLSEFVDLLCSDQAYCPHLPLMVIEIVRSPEPILYFIIEDSLAHLKNPCHILPSS